MMKSLDRGVLAAVPVIAFHILSTGPAMARDGAAVSSFGPSSTSLWVTRLKSATPKPNLTALRSRPHFQTVDEIAAKPGAFELSFTEGLGTREASTAFDLAASQSSRREPSSDSSGEADDLGEARALVAVPPVRREMRAGGNGSEPSLQSLWQLASKATRQWADIGGLSAAVVQNVRLEGAVARGVSQPTGLAWAQSDGYAEILPSSNMLNGYVDFDTGTKLTPYVGAGLGTVTYNLGGTGIGRSDIDSENAFNDSDVGYQGMAGLSYDLADNWSLSAEYRYAGALDYGRSYRTVEDWDDTSHSARINFTKSFDLLQ